MEIGNVCICGGGSLGSVIAGVLASRGVEVNILTGRPELWGGRIEVTDQEGLLFEGPLSRVSSDPAEVIPQAVLFCLLGFMSIDLQRQDVDRRDLWFIRMGLPELIMSHYSW